MDDNEAAAASGEFLDARFFIGLKIAAALAVDDEHVGAGEFFV